MMDRGRYRVRHVQFHRAQSWGVNWKHGDGRNRIWRWCLAVPPSLSARSSVARSGSPNGRLWNWQRSLAPRQSYGSTGKQVSLHQARAKPQQRFARRKRLFTFLGHPWDDPGGAGWRGKTVSPIWEGIRFFHFPGVLNFAWEGHGYAGALACGIPIGRNSELQKHWLGWTARGSSTKRQFPGFFPSFPNRGTPFSTPLPVLLCYTDDLESLSEIPSFLESSGNTIWHCGPSFAPKNLILRIGAGLAFQGRNRPGLWA